MEKKRDEKNYKEIYKSLDKKRELKIIKPKETEEIPAHYFDNFTIKTKETKALNSVNDLNYDMDAFDADFLSKNKLNISRTLFEFVIDRLEKDWFSFIDLIMKSNPFTFSSVSYYCDICADSTFTTENDLIYCDSCNLCVHQECYGVQNIPEGFWLCRKCLIIGKRTVKCEYCPNSTGALKQTVDGKFCHVVCALYHPSLIFLNNVFLEPISIEKDLILQKTEKCVICSSKAHFLINCSFNNCKCIYHITCALQEEGFYFDHNNFISYCKMHSPDKSLIHWKIKDFFGFDSLSYKKINEVPKIRKIAKLHIPEYSNILDIINTKPICYESMFLRLKKEVFLLFGEVDESILICICKYWQKKHSYKNECFIPEIHLFNGTFKMDDWFKDRY